MALPRVCPLVLLVAQALILLLTSKYRGGGEGKMEGTTYYSKTYYHILPAL